MSKSNKGRSGLNGLARPYHDGRQHVGSTSAIEQDKGAREANIISDSKKSEPWWRKVTNDLGLFCLTLLTLIVIAIYTYYTKQLVTDTELSYTAVQRAFVSPEQPIKAESTVEGTNKVWTFTSIMRNDGATPTKNLQFYQSTPCIPEGGNMSVIPERSGPVFQCNFTTKSGHVMPPEPSDPEEVFQKREKFSIQSYSLAPRASATIDKVSVPEADLLKMANDGHPWFIQGIAHYNDVFPHSILHRTEYCFRVVMWNGNPIFFHAPSGTALMTSAIRASRIR